MSLLFMEKDLLSIENVLPAPTARNGVALLPPDRQAQSNFLDASDDELPETDALSFLALSENLTEAPVLLGSVKGGFETCEWPRKTPDPRTSIMAGLSWRVRALW
jgi:hypothetical protein